MSSTGIALPSHDPGARRVGGQRQAPADLTRGKEILYLLLQEAGWTSKLVRMGSENLAPHRGRVSNPEPSTPSFFSTIFVVHVLW